MGWNTGLLDKDTSKPLIYRFLKRQRRFGNDLIAQSSQISNDPVLDAADFDWAQAIAPHW